MTTLPTFAMLAALATVGQDPGGIPVGWGDDPAKAPAIEDPNAEAADENRLRVALAAAERLGADRLQTAVPLAELGTFYLSRKRYDQAEPLLRRSLAIREAHLAPDHPDVASSLYLLGTCRAVAHRKQDRTAGPMLRRALAIYEKVAPGGPEVARSLHLLAIDHMMRHEYDAAEADLARALAIEEKQGGPESDDAAALLDDLGDLFMARASSSFTEDLDAEMAGKPKAEWPSERFGRKAEEAYRRALAIREKVLPPDDPHVAETLFNLGQFLTYQVGRPAEAGRFLERWLAHPAIAKAPPDEKHAKAYVMLSESSRARKDWAEADRRLSRAEEIVRKLHGADSPEVGIAVWARADLAIDAGWFDVAEKLLREMLEGQASRLGDRDPDIVAARELMAGGYRAHLDDRLAPILWRRVNERRDRIWQDRKREDLAEILQTYASLLCRSNHVLPPPTAEDLAYLQEVGAMVPEADLNDLAMTDSLVDGKLDDAALAHVARLYLLESLNLSGLASHNEKKITDAGLAHLTGLVSLNHLDLRDAAITDAGLAHLTGLENLDQLLLVGTRITDAGLVHLKGLKKLRRLSLAVTEVTDEGLKTLRSMPGLRSIDLSHTKATEAGVAELRRARPDVRVEYEPGYELARPEPIIPE